jgi:transcription elongation factor Elf1
MTKYYYPCPKCGRMEDIESCCMKEGNTVWVHCICGVNRTTYNPKLLKKEEE